MHICSHAASASAQLSSFLAYGHCLRMIQPKTIRTISHSSAVCAHSCRWNETAKATGWLDETIDTFIANTPKHVEGL
jgi:hypothetical protein